MGDVEEEEYTHNVPQAYNQAEEQRKTEEEFDACPEKDVNWRNQTLGRQREMTSNRSLPVENYPTPQP